MMNRCILACAFAVAATALTSSSAHSQAMPAASRPGLLQAGITYSSGNNDELDKRITGGSIYATFDWSEHIGVEVNAVFLTFNTPQDLGQEMYLIGPRYVYRYKDRYQPYIKLQAGIGKMVAEEPYASEYPGTPGSYGVFSFGGGLDIKIPYNLTVRAINYDYEMWPGFQPHGLSPTVVSFGIAYHIR
jgi:hypothetical protein